MTLDINNWSSSAHQEIHKIIKDEIFPIVNQVDARVQNFEIQFLKEAAKFVRDFKSLAKEADESIAKQQALELEIERLLKAVVSQDIMSIVLNPPVVETSDLQTKLEPYNDMQQKIERLQHLGDQKGKSKDTSCVSNTLDHLSQKLENENVELEFQILNYAKENAHLKTTYKNLFDFIFVSDQKDTIKGTRVNTQFCEQSILGNPPSSSKPKLYDVTPFPKSKGLPKINETHALSKPTTSNSVPTPPESKVMKNDNVIAPGMTNPITISQPHVITKKGGNSNFNGLSSTGVDNTAKTRRPQPKSNTKNDRVPSASKSSCIQNKELAIRNAKSEVVCAICKQCLITDNHDVCVLKYVNDLDSRGCSKHMTGNLKLLINFVWKFFGTVRFGNDHVVAILGFGDLQWGHILITMVYFVEGLGHNLFSVGKFCDSDLEVAFRRNTCFVRNLEGVDLLKGNLTTNLYTINLHEIASASPICLMSRATSTKSWLRHQRLSHLNFDTINDLAKNDLVTVLEQRNRTLVDAARTMLIFSHALLFLWAEAIATACYTQNRSIIYRRVNKTPYELINDRKSDISFLHVFGALYYPKNDREDIRKLGAKGDISFFIGYFADSRAYRVYNQRTKKIMETMNVTFDELSAMAFEQSSSKPRLQSMTSGQISLGLNHTYAPSTITTQQPTEGELDLLFKYMYDDHFGGQPSAAPRTVTAAQAPQVPQNPTTTTTAADTAPTPTNSSSQATNFPNTSQDNTTTTYSTLTHNNC
ncbi:retrovirus-related pol polyprotein from transposon TNT 1-94 [Tanacetum coccineum]